jgi:tRNA nucleotidyltransferase (CCA-adding enzyme)
MKSTRNLKSVQRDLETLLDKQSLLKKIVNAISQAGGRALLVGGAVRDLFLGAPTKDLDIEIYGLKPDELEGVLRSFGPVSLVGKQFGVLRLHGLDIDWSLPRSDSAGRKPEVSINPHMPFEQAFARRDLTINAMGLDLKTFELIDPFNGVHDLKNGVLRAPNAHFFDEDPLRLFRVMQFMGRLGMVPDEELNRICKKMDISAVSRERIESEFEKMLLKSEHPSRGLRWLKEIGRLDEILPELAATIGVRQPDQYHPEGDVFEHSMQALDAAARFDYDDPNIKLMVMYAALCHDLGKVTTTREIDGRLRSLEHAQAGVPITKTMLSRITQKKELIDGVSKLVRYHMEPMIFVNGGATSAAYKRLAHKLEPHTTIQYIADLSLADRQGRNPNGSEPLTDIPEELKVFLHHAGQIQVKYGAEKPVLLGRDIADIVAPGPQMGKLLARAYDIQIEEGITDKEELKKRIKPFLKKPL